MKKSQLFLLAMVFVAMGTAFATTRPAVKITEDQYYLSDGTMQLVTGAGDCVPSTGFCKYTLISGQPNDGDPAHYEGVPNTENRVFIPR
jgi:hypothetical protein